MENWMILAVAFAVFVLVGFVFVAYLIYADDVSERRRVVMCSMYVLLFAALVVFFAIKGGETIKDSLFPVKTAADSPVETNEENENSSFVVEPNDTTEAGSFVTEAYQRGDHSVVQAMEMELRNNQWALASYLQEYDVLDEFYPSEGPSADVPVNAAALLFSRDEDVREEAYRKAKKLFHDSLADAAWEEFKKTDPRSDDFDTYEEYQAYLRNLAAPTKIRPLARIAETGETISTEPAGPWEGPSD